jgi:hypothetical protein
MGNCDGSVYCSFEGFYYFSGVFYPAVSQTSYCSIINPLLKLLEDHLIPIIISRVLGFAPGFFS